MFVFEGFGSFKRRGNKMKQIKKNAIQNKRFLNPTDTANRAHFFSNIKNVLGNRRGR